MGAAKDWPADPPGSDLVICIVRLSTGKTTDHYYMASADFGFSNARVYDRGLAVFFFHVIVSKCTEIKGPAQVADQQTNYELIASGCVGSCDWWRNGHEQKSARIVRDTDFLFNECISSYVHVERYVHVGRNVQST